MDSTDAARQDGARRTKDQADRLVLDVVAAHADSLLRTARRFSYCHDDAQDAYQRTLEIFVRRAPSLDGERVVGWVHTVVRNEALAVRAKRGDVSVVDQDFDREEARDLPSPEDAALSHELVAQTAEALQTLKPQEVQALWHKALGKSYDEIATDLQWTYTKVNRCLAEGRKALRVRFEGIQTGAECERWAPVLSALVDGEASSDDLAAVRPHLRNCAGCRGVVRGLHAQTQAIAAVLPPVALVSQEAVPAGDAPGLLSRLYESVATFFGERATMSAIKLQSAADLVGGGKVAAVAASAAAVAGGGAVAAERVVERSKPATPPARVVQREAAASPAPAPRPAVGPARSASPPPAQPARLRGRVRSARSREFALRRAKRSAASREFGSGSARTASRAPAPPPAPDSTPTATPFESEAPAPRPTPQPTSAPSGAEFGF